MPDVEDSSPLVDPSQRCCNVWTIILHVAMVSTLYYVILFGYIHIYHVLYKEIASLIIELIAYLALACLYIYNSSFRQDKYISAGYLIVLMSVFLICFGTGAEHREDTHLIEPISLANMVAISSYLVWKCSFILNYCRLKKLVRTILHGAIVASLLVVLISAYVLNHTNKIAYGSLLQKKPYQTFKAWLLIQLVSYNAVAFLFICNSSDPKEKVISAVLLVLVVFVFLLCSFATKGLRTDLIFGANIVVISSYCIWKLYPYIRPWLDALDAHTEPREPARQEEAVLQLQQSSFHIKDLPKEFSSNEIQSITQDFGNRIGHGASAQVFHGSLDDGTTVAVKCIHMHSGRTEAGEDEFRREISIIANVHHRSLVRLLGYCLQHGGGLYLVYPFFENGSLDRWIFNCNDEQRRLLTWPKRFCIAVDVARALAYLHNDCHRRILHLDIKPENILLDGDLPAHVSDFGISLSITRDLTSVINTRGRGTFGYMAPEMLVNAVSDRSDVFSYGMTLLELVGGRRNFDPSSSAMPDPNLARNLQEKMAQGKHMELVDAAMVVAVDDGEVVMTALKVAICCIQHERDMRPSMQNVVDMLEGRVAINLLPKARHPSSSAVISEPNAIPEHGAVVIDMQGCT